MQNKIQHSQQREMITMGYMCSYSDFGHELKRLSGKILILLLKGAEQHLASNAASSGLVFVPVLYIFF